MDHHRKLRSIGAFILWAVLLTGIASAAGEEGLGFAVLDGRPRRDDDLLLAG